MKSFVYRYGDTDYGSCIFGDNQFGLHYLSNFQNVGKPYGQIGDLVTKIELIQN